MDGLLSASSYHRRRDRATGGDLRNFCDQISAIDPDNAETEASFETIVFLANKMDELGLPAILQIESADGSIAKTIRENTATKDQEILTLDSPQSTTSADAAARF